MAVIRQLTPIHEIRKRAKVSRKDAYYRKLYLLKRFMAGDFNGAVASMTEWLAGSGAYSEDPDLAEFPEIETPYGEEGTQNFAQVSSRINIQSVVYADPELQFNCDLPLVKQVNKEWVRQRWEEGMWGDKFYEVGMEVEGTGIGVVELGINEYSLTDLAFRDTNDVMFDWLYRSPSDWRYVFRRDRLSVDDCMERYASAGLTRDELVGMARVMPKSTTYEGGNQLAAQDQQEPVVREWVYYDRDTHVVFLGQIACGKSIVLKLGPNGYERCGTNGYVEEDGYGYGKEEVELGGPNPYGQIPFSFWVDSWSPGVKMPVGKMETTWRIAAMLIKVQRIKKLTIERALPLTVISTYGLTPKQIKALRDTSARIESLGEIIPMDMANVSQMIHRVAPGEISQTLLATEADLKNEFNASTGVMDAQRGAIKSGEQATATGERLLYSAQGVQAQHTRKRFAHFLNVIVQKARWIGAAYETGPSVLYLDEGPMDLSRYNRRAFLSYQMSLHVDDSSLQYKTDEDKINERIAQLNAIDLKGIELGVLDPVKVFRDVYKKLGKRDPDMFMKDGVTQGTNSANPPVAPGAVTQPEDNVVQLLNHIASLTGAGR